MVEAAPGKRLQPNELAGSEMHELSGGIDLLVADEPAAIAAAKRHPEARELAAFRVLVVRW